MSDYLTEGWPLGPTSTVYMDGTSLYAVRHYGKPGQTNVRLSQEHADLIREVVAERIKQVEAEIRDQIAAEIEASEANWHDLDNADQDADLIAGVINGHLIAARIARPRKDT